jgi:hypothetical protein
MRSEWPNTLTRPRQPSGASIQAFMNFDVNDMGSCLNAMERVYERAKKFHDEMMRRELKRLSGVGVKKMRAKPAANIEEG